MKNCDFSVKATWDADAGVFVSESDIVGLHIEAQTLEEFRQIMDENALDLIADNHVECSANPAVTFLHEMS